MSATIRQLYINAGLTPPDGKGIHKRKFHQMAVAIKRDNPEYSMSRCYSIAMGKLGAEGAVRKHHRRKG